ncbi:unnamed protein product [Protopolystoma xenopodis]|uniref:Uncharacterized protein n=1 Tax=Protopolystoma xenopodis TaxID=117903 RepID=A0A3S5BW02_9PLAT|nr:unnamed protein product [Protopolystoma xenopodis]
MIELIDKRQLDEQKGDAEEARIVADVLLTTRSQEWNIKCKSRFWYFLMDRKRSFDWYWATTGRAEKRFCSLLDDGSPQENVHSSSNRHLGMCQPRLLRAQLFMQCRTSVGHASWITGLLGR